MKLTLIIFSSVALSCFAGAPVKADAAKPAIPPVIDKDTQIEILSTQLDLALAREAFVKAMTKPQADVTAADAAAAIPLKAAQAQCGSAFTPRGQKNKIICAPNDAPAPAAPASAPVAPVTSTGTVAPAQAPAAPAKAK